MWIDITMLTFLALCNINPEQDWKNATRISMRMNKQIIKFCIDNYNLNEGPNNRDQFRKEGINILLNHSIIDLNPDDQNIGPNSPRTHYAINKRVLKQLIS